MWFKVFVLLRISVSATLLFGYASVAMGMGLFGGAVFLAVYVFLVVLSVTLFHRYRGALRLVWWLLWLELFGAFAVKHTNPTRQENRSASRSCSIVEKTEQNDRQSGYKQKGGRVDRL
jgi:hypothetical protein